MVKKKEKLVRFNRNNILETAETLFAEKGVRNTTMDDISRAADYSKSTIYVYFKSKEEIYQHIIYKHMCHLRDAAYQRIQRAERFEQCYYGICGELVTISEQYPLYFESMMDTICIEEKELEQCEILRDIYEAGEAINDNMSILFQRGVQEGFLRPDIPILPSVFTLWASLASIITLAGKKEAYFSKRIGMSKAEFLQYAFQMLLTSLQ